MEDWLRTKREQEERGVRFTAVMDLGAPADGEAAMDLAEEARQQICRFHYDCTYEIHVGLAEMYLADDRFRQFYEDIKPGMAEYLHDAILANALRRD